MISEFRGTNRFLSNFWYADVMFDGVLYKTVEHAFQAAKSLDPAVRQSIGATSAPGQAKRAGRLAPLRHDWEAVKLATMEELVRDKFTRYAPLGKQLLATGDQELVEGNRWNDTFWGVCRGLGQNHLGRILMKVRSELRSAT